MHGNSALEVAIKLRPRPDELAELGPEFLPVWNEFFADKPDKPMIWLCLMVGYVAISYHVLLVY
jgi:alcohol oxidase